MRISNFIEESLNERSFGDLFRLLEKAAADCGFDWVAYGALHYHDELRTADNPAPALLLNYPSFWQQRYFERNYQAIDPVVLFTHRFVGPYSWSALGQAGDLQDKHNNVLDEANEAGLRTGVSVPIHGPWGRLAVISFASSSGVKDTAAHLGILNAFAQQFHISYVQLKTAHRNHEPMIILTQRERECLAWTAEGKSSWDIGSILSISENTVNFHIKGAMHKLGVTSRTAASLKAMRLNLIEVSGLGLDGDPIRVGSRETSTFVVRR